jgi:hypothetical protein
MITPTRILTLRICQNYDYEFLSFTVIVRIQLNSKRRFPNYK